MAEVGSGYRRRKTRAWCEIQPLGCRELRAPTWRKSNEPLCRSPAPAGSANRRVDQFHRLFMYSRLRVCPVSPGDLSCKSLSDCVKQSNLYFQLIRARMVLSEIRRHNLKRHKVRMRVRPRDRVSLCFKKSVDDDGLELARSPPAQTSRFATNDRRPCVDRRAGAIREDNFTAVRNSFGIDCTMSGA
jgi:hypothetical protein